MNKLLVLLLSLTLVSTGFALRVTTLYQASVPVATQSVEERNAAAAQGLAQVFIKVSGDSQLLNNYPALKTKLPQAANLVEEFSYSNSTLPDKNFMLNLNFDSKAVNRILQEESLPLWGKNRPLVIGWIDYEYPGRVPAIVDNDAANPVNLALQRHSDRRGLPVILPMMDVDEMNKISTDEVVKMNIPFLTTASKRYEASALLIGRIIPQGNGWTGQWKLIMKKDEWNWTTQGKTVDEVVSDLMDKATDALAGRYAVVVTNDVQSKLTLKISGVTEQDDLSRIIEYLQHLTPVADVQLSQVSGDQVIVAVNVRGSREAFMTTVAQGQRLTQQSEPENTILNYQWNH